MASRFSRCDSRFFKQTSIRLIAFGIRDLLLSVDDQKYTYTWCDIERKTKMQWGEINRHETNNNKKRTFFNVAKFICRTTFERTQTNRENDNTLRVINAFWRRTETKKQRKIFSNRKPKFNRKSLPHCQINDLTTTTSTRIKSQKFHIGKRRVLTASVEFSFVLFLILFSCSFFPRVNHYLSPTSPSHTQVTVFAPFEWTLRLNGVSARLFVCVQHNKRTSENDWAEERGERHRTRISRPQHCGVFNTAAIHRTFFP